MIVIRPGHVLPKCRHIYSLGGIALEEYDIEEFLSTDTNIIFATFSLAGNVLTSINAYY